ncbi:restriction endonuclease subunit S [Aeromonas mytilicola]|uniref:restriction endonuclease subunit S n=1 Tax=Aeromonas salmonicida TaxID=645 RepID=UPI000C1B9146|nr:restriction endonuclease subunit S [Aeromonas salmonicida]ATU98060.1 hypothetical protein CHQ57_11830 [Aeromonas salmonicida]
MSEFDLIALGDIADIRMGQSPDSSSYTDDDRFMPFLQGCGDFSEEFPETHVFCANPGKVAPEGSVLVSVRAPVGTTNIADQEYCIGRGLASVKSSVLPAVYLREIFNLSASFLYRRAQGSTFDAISSQDLRAFPIPVPKKKEQLEQLVDIFQSVNLEIRTTQALIDKYGVIKQGMMADLFSRGIDPTTAQLRPSVQDAPELYHETPLGSLPKGWEALTMQSVADDSRGSTVIGPFGSDLVASDYRPEGVPVVFVRDVKESCFRWVSDTFISNEKAQRLSAHSVTKGDVVVTKMGLPPCIAATYPDDMPCGVITADIIRIRPNADKVLSEWLSLVINSNEVKKQVEKITAGVTRPKVTLKDFRQLQGRFPTRTEQHEILKRLNPINSSIKLGELSLAKLQRQKAGLMHDLLTGKVPVSA